MSQEIQTGTKVRARVLVSGAHGQVDQVVEIDSGQIEAMAGIVDTHQASVAYAESLVAGGEEGGPSIAELLAARDALLRREGELNEQSERVRVQASDNLAEAGRLADLRAQLDADVAQLASDRATFEAGKFATAPDLSGMTKEQLQAALDEKGIKYPAAANKAELHALLAVA